MNLEVKYQIIDLGWISNFDTHVERILALYQNVIEERKADKHG